MIVVTCRAINGALMKMIAISIINRHSLEGANTDTQESLEFNFGSNLLWKVPEKINYCGADCAARVIKFPPIHRRPLSLAFRRESEKRDELQEPISFSLAGGKLLFAVAAEK